MGTATVDLPPSPDAPVGGPPPRARRERRVRAPSRARRIRRSVELAGVLVALGVWGAIVAVHLQRADRGLRAGIAAAQRARDELSSQDLTADTAAADLTAASRSFSAAHAEVASAWLAPLHLVPIVNTQIRSVEDLSGAAQVVTASGTTTLATVHRILTATHTTPAARAAQIDSLATAVADLEASVSRVSLGPERGLIGALVTKRDTFAADLVTLQRGLLRADGATSALADVLIGPRTYLIAATNNAEMRAGSGMILQAGSLKTRDGDLNLGPVAPTSLLVVGTTPVQASGDLAALWGFEHPTLDFRDLLLSPQFPPNAALAAQMWQHRTGQHIDGVVTVDIAALADLLGATGPVTVAGTTFTAANVTEQLLVTQYAHLGTAQANAARHEELGALAGQVFAAALGGRTSVSAMATAFDRAIDGRHLQVWAATPSIEDDWTAAGVGGAVGGDDILLSLLNQGANKLDPYQQVRARIAAVTAAGGTEVTVQVTVDNTTPSTLVGYPAGGAAGDPPARQYTGAVALDIPLTAGAVTSSGGPLEAAGPDYGATVRAVAIAVPSGQSRTVTFRFRLAGASGHFSVVPSARLPATSWTWVPPTGPAQDFTDSTGRTLSW